DETAGTARRPGLGKQGGKVYVRNQRQSPSSQTPTLNLADMSRVAARVHTSGQLRCRVSTPGQEATGKSCGLPVARLQGHSWPVGDPVVPSRACYELVELPPIVNGQSEVVLDRIPCNAFRACVDGSGQEADTSRE